MNFKISLFSFFLFFFLTYSSSINIDSGNVTTLIVYNSTNTSSWDGFYGNVLYNSTTSPQLVSITGGKLTELNLYVSPPNCSSYNINSINIIASNSYPITLPLTPGNLTHLDLFMGDVLEKASNTFYSTDTYNLNYGTYTSIPTFHFKNKTSQLKFKEGYFNDVNHNFIFVSNVCFDCLNWNGSLSDYQIMLPKNLTENTQYYLWVDFNYTCVSPPTSPSYKKHRVKYINPVSEIEVNVYENKTQEIQLQNYGDYNEDLTISFSLSNDYCSIISPSNLYIKSGSEEYVNIEIYCVKSFEQTLVEMIVKNNYINEKTSFIVNVLGECKSNDDCDENHFCNSNFICEPKKEINETCNNNEDCEWNELCVNGLCELITGCGFIENHELIPYECCSNSECSPYHVCINNECVFKSLHLYLFLENDNILIEGNEYLFKIVDNLNFPIDGVMIKSELVSYSDENGYASVVIPYDGIIHLEKMYYYDKKIQLDYYKLGFYDYSHNELTNEITFTLYDSKKNVLEDVEIYIDGILIGKTNSDGKLSHYIENYNPQLTFIKENYIIKGDKLNLNECNCFCTLLCPFIGLCIIISIILYKIKRKLFILPLLLFILFYVILSFNYYLVPIILLLLILLIVILFKFFK